MGTTVVKFQNHSLQEVLLGDEISLDIVLVGIQDAGIHIGGKTNAIITDILQIPTH